MSVLIVIPCLDEEKYLERLIRKLIASNRTLPMRIVIADGGSTDQTPAIAAKLATEYPQVLFLPNPKRIQSAAVNLAVKTHGQNDTFLIRLDAHADYPDDFCQILIDEAEKTNAASVVTAMKTEGQGWFQGAVAAAQNSFLGNGGAAHRSVPAEGKWVDHGHHALMRIETFRSVGGYDENFPYNEDAELDIRLRRSRHTIWLTNRTSLVYYPRSSPAGLFRQYFGFGQGRARTFLKHHMRPRLRQLAPAAVAPALLLALIGSNTILALPFAAWMALCLGYGIALAIKQRTPALAAAGPAAMIMHLSWSLGFWKVIMLKLYEDVARR